MGSVIRTLSRPNLPFPFGQGWPAQTLFVAGWRRKYRLTLFFAITAIMLIAAAAIVVNIIVGNLAEGNLIGLARENTARDGLHMQSMMRTGHSMSGGSSAGTVHSGEAMKDMGQSMIDGTPSGTATEGTKDMREMQGTMSRGMNRSEAGDSPNTMQDTQNFAPLTLQSLAGSGGLPTTYASLVHGLNILQFDLLDLSDKVVWSSNPETIGLIKLQTAEREKAAAGAISSRLDKDFEVVDQFGGSHRTDVVATVLPLRETPSGDIIGITEIYRDIAHDVALQVNDAKSVVLWTTVGTMGGLFLFLLGFIVIADVNISRSNRREMLVVEEANQDLEARVQECTRELQEAQDRLVRSEKLAAIGQLAGGLAHDLRNPLGAVKNAVFYLKSRVGSSELAQSNPRIGQFLGIIDEEVEHSNEILSDLMSFARVGVFSISPTNLEGVIDNALSSIELRENVQLVKRLDPDLPEIPADGEQLYRVFMNLANNAQDAMPDGGRLTISARREDKFVEVAFSDAGVGISDEVMKNIFEPLFTTKTKGTGLGLSVCQQIVSKHNGSMNVASKEGEGATFTVRLPLDRDGS